MNEGMNPDRHIDQPGYVTDDILLMGRPESCVYLLHGKEESVLLGGGMAYIVPDLLQQINAFGIDEQRIRRICILHAHFDHCGAVPFLKKRWPWAVITASGKARDLLARADVSETICQMNQEAITQRGLDTIARTLDFGFTGVIVEETLAEGDLLTCGNIELQVLEVPGHSSCSIALYMPSRKALFASDAVGVRKDGIYQPTPNSNYDQYQQSLARLSRFDLQVLLLEHYGSYLGQEAKAFIPKAIEAARETRHLLEETYRKTRDVDKCTQEVAALFKGRATDSFLSNNVRTMVAGQMVRYIARTLDKAE